jgi:hypothetical protein
MVVDDEAFQRNVLQLALQRQFAGDGVDIEAFNDPIRALVRARNSDFAVVIADYRMPGMNGIAFLKEMLEIRPDTVRLMLTASTEIETAMTAVNEAEVFRFIRKPWDQDFRRAVADALARNASLVAERVSPATDVIHNETAQQRAWRELEASEPGITRVRWGPDGSVLLQ